NLDIARESTSQIAAEANACLTTGADRIVVLADDTGTGKTTMLRRIALDFAIRRINVLTCSALSRLDPQRTAEAIELIGGPVLIVVDNFADQATAIADVVTRLRRRDVAVLGAERRYRMPYLSRVLSKVSSKIVDDLGPRYIEAERLLNLYL